MPATLRVGLIHPVPLTLLALSGLLALVVVGLPRLAPGSGPSDLPGVNLTRGETLGVLATGVAAYVLSVCAVSLWPPSGPYFRLLRATRRRTRRLLRRRAAAAPVEIRSALVQLENDAGRTIQDEISPSFRRVLRKATDLNADIKSFGRERPAPEPALLDELKADYAHFVEARQICVQQAINGEARLVSILQEADSSLLVARVRSWIDDDLGGLQRALDQALRGRIRVEPEPLPGPDPVPDIPPTPAGLPPAGLVQATERALRRLNKLGELGQSDLAGLLPRSLAAKGRLSRGQGLYDLLVEGIQRLKPETDQQGLVSAHYEILWREYVRGESTVAIGHKLAVSPSGFYRWRQQAVAALAQDLWEREHRLPPLIAGPA